MTTQRCFTMSARANMIQAVNHSAASTRFRPLYE
jgi:hypothetical protein